MRVPRGVHEDQAGQERVEVSQACIIEKGSAELGIVSVSGGTYKLTARPSTGADGPTGRYGAGPGATVLLALRLT